MSAAQAVRRRYAAAGFTLLEVLVATGMVAIALVAGLASSMTLTRHAERQTEVLLAQLCAQNTLAGLRLARQLPALGESLSNCEQAGRSFELGLSVQATPDAGFRRVRAQVRAIGAPDASGQRRASPVLLRLDSVIGPL
jgi:general secretion pathway protein I